MKKETFCRYIRQYETDMFRFAKSIVGTQADGEDAMQESILKAYENIDTLRSRRKFKAWIFQILANECYQILRNRRYVRKRKRFRISDSPLKIPKIFSLRLDILYACLSGCNCCRQSCRSSPDDCDLCLHLIYPPYRNLLKMQNLHRIW